MQNPVRLLLLFILISQYIIISVVSAVRHDMISLLKHKNQYAQEIKNLSSYYLSYILPVLSETRDRSCALFTVAHNEGEMLPLWLRYYTQHVSLRDIYILDDRSTDGSLKDVNPDINIILMPAYNNKSMSHEYDVRYVESYGTQFFAFTLLLAGYKCYISVDVDELLVVDPEKYPGGLQELIREFIVKDGVAYLRATGRDLLHVSVAPRAFQKEPSLIFNKPILAQRSYWINNTMYDKAFMSKIPIRYVKGKHQATIASTGYIVARSGVSVVGYPISPTVLAPYNNESWVDDEPNPDVTLLHLHSIDLESCLRREKYKYYNLSYYFEGQRDVGDKWDSAFTAKKKVSQDTACIYVGLLDFCYF